MFRIDHTIGPAKLSTGEWGLPLTGNVSTEDLGTFIKWRNQLGLTESQCYIGEYSVADIFGDIMYTAIIGRSENLRLLALLTFP
jgi:hypothetical protein